MPQPESRDQNAAVTRPIGNAVVALLPVLACFLGGATEKWAEGIVVAVLGFYLLARPPRVSLGFWINLVLLVFALLAGIAFLRANWFFQPSSRSALTADFGIGLPTMLYPQTWITVGCLL